MNLGILYTGGVRENQENGGRVILWALNAMPNSCASNRHFESVAGTSGSPHIPVNTPSLHGPITYLVWSAGNRIGSRKPRIPGM